MESFVVECLQCRTTRVARRDTLKHHFDSPECPECGYLGWIPVPRLAPVQELVPRKPRRAERWLHSVA
ncbi:MAG TPA: hypothetical protein VKO84_02195 [Gaiellaceae bacterium]|nr:hypothetical protein [Gaiellaceae bacterium]